MAKIKTKKLTGAKSSVSIIADQENKDALSTAVVVSSMEKKAAPAIRKLKKLDKIKTQEDFNDAAENLKLLKDIAKQASAEEADLAKEAYEIIEKAKTTVNKISRHFEPFQDKIKALEIDTKAKMEKFLEAARVKAKSIEKKFEKGGMSISKFSSQVAAISFQKGGVAKIREMRKLEIVDEGKIPREFMLPNRAAIEAELKAGKKVAGCELKTVSSIAI